jgi:H+/Cl- antiporter ClcA
MEQHAHNLPEILHFIEDVPWARGIIFGFVHTLIPLIGFYSGWSINRFLKIISNGAIAGIIGVVFAHIIADFIAAVLDPSLKSAAIGIVIGGLIPLSVVPFLEKYLTKSKYHIVAGDHEDIKTDISKKHK